mmetsp:Transcript_66238/g.148799  ORF Transcript_66238/g.148799 Transcript_66238/m.148799 type:complete len:148 (-) Transcript_66238:48-491(-)
MGRLRKGEVAPGKVAAKAPAKAKATTAAAQGGKERGGTLLERREAKRQKPEYLTKEQRRKRNVRFAEEYQEERLRASFGASRDWVPRKQKRDLKSEFVPEDDCEDSNELAPVRRKLSRLDENLRRLAKKPDPLMANIMNKALANRAT